MNVGNSSAFLLVGALMCLGPGLAPDYFAVTGPYEDNTSALWLKFMGLLHGFVGVASMLAVWRAAVRQKKRRFRNALAALLARLRPRADVGPACDVAGATHWPRPAHADAGIVHVLERSAGPRSFGEGIDLRARWLNERLRFESAERTLEFIRRQGLADQIFEARDWNSAITACGPRGPLERPPTARAFWEARRGARESQVSVAADVLVRFRDVMLSDHIRVCVPDGSELSTRTPGGRDLWRSIGGKRWPMSSIDYLQAALSRGSGAGGLPCRLAMFSRPISASTSSDPPCSPPWSWQLQ